MSNHSFRGGTVMQRYELGRLLGQGSFAKVYHAKNIESDQSVAVKVIDKEKVMRVGLAEQIEREISIMRLVRHPNIVRLYEVMATKSKIYFIMEYIRGGELFDRVAKGRLKEEVARKYFQQLINAVDFCHSRGVYHRDLKPENLLLHDDETLKVSDFGLSALVESKREGELLYTTCGTPAYVAPEVIHRKGYNGAKADIWSCGVVLFVLLAGYLPFHDSNLMEMYRRISKPDYKCPNWFPPEARKLISRILDPNPSTRISIEKIKENCWVRKGLYSRQMKSKAESKDKAPLKEEAILIPSEGSSRGAVAKLERGTGLANMNAFDIICLSDGFNLSGLFEDKRYSKVARFLSRQTASTILSKLEDIGRRFKLKAGKKGSGVLRLETLREGRKGVLTIDAEIFELASSFYLVEVKKSSGDTLEYQKILKEDLRPALKDIVFAWQGEHKLEDEQQQQEHELQLT